MDGGLHDSMVRPLVAQAGLGDVKSLHRRAIFVYGFPKSERGNIDKVEEDALKQLATHLLSLTVQAVTKAKHAGELIEVNCDAQDEIPHSGSRA